MVAIVRKFSDESGRQLIQLMNIIRTTTIRIVRIFLNNRKPFDVELTCSLNIEHTEIVLIWKSHVCESRIQFLWIYCYHVNYNVQIACLLNMPVIFVRNINSILNINCKCFKNIIIINEPICYIVWKWRIFIFLCFEILKVLHLSTFKNTVE